MLHRMGADFDHPPDPDPSLGYRITGNTDQSDAIQRLDMETDREALRGS